MAIKVLAQEETVSNTMPESISSAIAVRLYNNNAGDVVVGRYDESNTIIGSTTLKAGTEMIFLKNSTDLIMVIGGAEIKATKIAVGV